MMRSLTRVRGLVTNIAIAGATASRRRTSSRYNRIVDLPTAVSTPTFTPTPSLVPQDCAHKMRSYASMPAAACPTPSGDGQLWLPDQPYTGTVSWGYVPATSSSSVYATIRTIAGADDQPIYQTERWWSGSGGYRFDVSNGYYRVVLKFAEIYPWAARGSRRCSTSPYRATRC